MSTRKLGLGLVGIVALLAAWKGQSVGPFAESRAAREEAALEPAAAKLSPEEASEPNLAELEIPEHEPLRSEPPEEEPAEVATEELPEPESFLEEEVLSPTEASLLQGLVEPEELGWVRGRLLAENGSFEAEVLELAGSIVLGTRVLRASCAIVAR